MIFESNKSRQQLNNSLFLTGKSKVDVTNYQRIRGASKGALFVSASAIILIMAVPTAFAEPLIISTGGNVDGWTVAGGVEVKSGEVSQTFMNGSIFSLIPRENEDMVQITPSGSTLNISGIDSFLGLSTGSVSSAISSGSIGFPIEGGTGYYLTPTNFGAIVKSSYLNTGTYTYGWAFSAPDYIPYTDGAFLSISGASTNIFNLLGRVGTSATVLGTSGYQSDTVLLGSYGSTGWIQGRFDITTAGTYTIGFGTFNVEDTEYDSFLYVSRALGTSTGQSQVISFAPAVIPDIDIAQEFYDTVQLANYEVNPFFVGGTLRILNSSVLASNFTIQSQGGTIDTFGYDVEIAGAMSGSGQLIKTGVGTLNLSGANTYSGGTLVSAGRLSGDTASLQGAIVNNAQVEFTQASDGTFAGSMAGSGAFYKSGAGSLTLGGITSITGAANIIAGRLNITGQLAAGSVTVQNAATLSGNGVIGGNVIVQSGGSLAPGESPGTLSVVGNVSFLDGSNFGAEIDGRTYNPAGGAGSYDLLRIFGTANLDGTITPTLRGITGAATNNYLPSIGESFVVLSAGTVAGNFSSIVQPSVGLPAGSRFDAIYGGDFVRLVITPGSFAALGNAQNWIGNGSSAARGIDNIRSAAGVRSGASQTLFTGLYGMNAGQLETVFSQISGEIYANSLQSVTETERSTFSSIFNASCDVSCGMPDGETNTNRSVWGRYIGKFANHDADQFSSGYNSSSKGLLIGATLTDSDNLQFGVAASYVENEVTTSLGASANANSTGGYLYVHFTPSDNFNVSNVLGVSLSNTQVSRSIGTTAGRVSTNSEKQTMTVMYGTKASYRGFVNGPLSLWTDVGLELSDTTSGRVQERAVNSDFALTLDKLSRRSAETQMAARLQLASDNTQISLSVGWVYQLGDDPSALRNVKLGDAYWTVRSVDAQRSGIRLGMQSRAQLSRRISLSAMYQHTNQDSGYKYDRVNLGLNLAF